MGGKQGISWEMHKWQLMKFDCREMNCLICGD